MNLQSTKKKKETKFASTFATTNNNNKTNFTTKTNNHLETPVSVINNETNFFFQPHQETKKQQLTMINAVSKLASEKSSNTMTWHSQNIRTQIGTEVDNDNNTQPHRSSTHAQSKLSSIVSTNSHTAPSKQKKNNRLNIDNWRQQVSDQSLAGTVGDEKQQKYHKINT